MMYSLGVMSIWRSFHSEVGISASRRSRSASLVETSWITAALPSARSLSIARRGDDIGRFQGGLQVQVDHFEGSGVGITPPLVLR